MSMQINAVTYQLPNRREKSTFLLLMTSDEGIANTNVEIVVEVVAGFDVDVVAVENVMSVVDIPHWTFIIPPSPPTIDACYMDSL